LKDGLDYVWSKKGKSDDVTGIGPFHAMAFRQFGQRSGASFPDFLEPAVTPRDRPDELRVGIGR
jgi:hypothetical protein